MKRVWLVLVVLALAAVACSTGPAPTPQVVYVEVTSTPVPATETPTPVPATPTPERLNILGVDLKFTEAYLAPSISFPPRTHTANEGYVLLVVKADCRDGLSNLKNWPKGTNEGSLYVVTDAGVRIYWGVLEYSEKAGITWLFAVPKGTSVEDYTLVLSGGVEVELAPLAG